MAVEVVMPRLGWGGEEGSLVEWLKRDGDLVQAGEVICTVEGDKAVTEVESLDSGILRIPPDSPPPGQKVPVGTVLAYLVQPGEVAPFEKRQENDTAAIGQLRPGSAAAALPTAAMAMSSAARVPQRTRRGMPPISPRARRVADELGIDWRELRGSGSSGRIVERDVRQAASPIGPLVQQTAAETGPDLETRARARPGEQVTRANGEAAARARNTGVPLPSGDITSGISPKAAAGPARRIPLGGIRQVIAQRLGESARTTVPVTLTTEADASELVRLRVQLTADLAGTDRPVPSYTDLLAKLVAHALQEHPALNASLEGGEIVLHSAINLGIAVDTERGLLVPVIRDVPHRSVLQIARETTRLIELARSGRIGPEDLAGGTFTLTNLGMYEIDVFTPVINLPECAILGIGRIRAQPVIRDAESAEIVIRRMLALSLTFDHRLVDGAPAARFLQRIKYLVEHPTLGLLD
jgi:pyruvate dehydrogenase E2 component (dihydrolipoamide acetyltransferase)